MNRPPDSLVSVGGPGFLVTAFAARLPPAMVQMGLLMIVVSSGSGFAAGGSMVAAVGLGSALGAPAVGHLNDRLSPLPVLVSTTAVQVLGLLGCLAALRLDWPVGVLLLMALLVGAANPQVGSVARARWSRLARAGRGTSGLVSRAMGYEGAADEIAFILGPAVSSIVVALIGPTPSLLALTGFVVLGQGPFAIQLARHRDEWAAHGSPVPARGSRPARVGPAIAVPLICGLGVGTMFGATQTALSALFTSLGQPSATGVVYGSLGIGSAFASLAVSRIPPRIPNWVRVVTGGLIVSASVATLGAQTTIWAAIACCIVLGVGVGVLLVTAYRMLEVVAPTSRLTAMMTWVSTSVVLGVSIGSLVAGWVADGWGPRAAFVPSVLAGVLSGLAGIAAIRLRPAAGPAMGE